MTKKFGALSENFRGKRVVLVDDSIVRGNTMGRIVKLLKGAGAKEVDISLCYMFVILGLATVVCLLILLCHVFVCICN